MNQCELEAVNQDESEVASRDELEVANQDKLEAANQLRPEAANQYTILYWTRGVDRYPPIVLHLLQGQSSENRSPYPMNTRKVPSNRGSLGNRCHYARGPERIQRTQSLPGMRLVNRWKEEMTIGWLKEQGNGFARAEALGKLGKREHVSGWSYCCQLSAECPIYVATDFIII